MALPDSKNLVTVERLSAVIGGTNGVWDKTKALVADKADKSATVSNVAWDSTNNKLTKTINGTTSNVVTAATIKTALSLTKSDVGLGNVDNTSDATKKTNFTGSIASGNTGFVTGGAAYTALNSKQDTITFDGTYSASTNKAATVSTVTSAIAALDGTVSGTPGAAKTLTAFSQTDGKVSATFANIAIAESQVTNLTTDLAAKAPLVSPTLTGTPTAPTASAGTNTTQIATTAFVKTAVEQGLATADALVYKGTVVGGNTGDYGALTPAASKGDVYKVTTAGKIDGVAVEVGDMLICNTDETAEATADNYTTIVGKWDFIQGNTEGVVIGPASAVDTHVAAFDGTTGKLIKDSGYTIAKSVPSNAVFTDTDTKVTSSANHYTPTTASGEDKSASASGATAAWGIDVVKGVTLNTDGKGHVTGISVTSGKIPANPNTDTKVKATAKTDDVNYKILATASASPTSGNATEAIYDADITLNPSTNTIAANISGNAATASAAKSGSALETAINGKAASGHTHTTALATDSGTASVTLAHNTTYKLTAGGTSVIFKTPTDNNTDTKVTQTALGGSETATYPVLLAPTGQSTTQTTTANFATALNYTPSTNTLAANVSGSAASAAKITTSAKIGDTNKGVYIAADGTVTAMSYTVSKSVPSNAVFTDTDTKVTSVSNHYAPTEDSTAEKDADGGAATQLPTSSSGTLVQVVTGVKMDAKGHVTGVVSKGLWSPDNNTTYTNASLGQGYGTCDTAAATAAKVVTLSNYALTTGGIVAVKFTYAVPASATLNINSQGAKAIYYRGAAITAGVIGAGDTATFVYDGTQYQLLSIDSGEQEMTETEVGDLLAALT